MSDDTFRLFENTADGAWVSGPKGDIQFWNEAAETMTGYPARQVVGKPCREVFGGVDRHGNRICRWPCPVKELFRQGDRVRHFDMATRTKTGKPIWIDVSCIALPRQGDGAPTLVHLFRNVTATRQIEALVQEQLAQRELATAERPALAGVGDLSKRELQVLTLMRTAATTTDIARQMCISKTTVRNHIQNIFRKLEVHSRLEAVAYVNRLEGQRGARPKKPE